jgi:hypothetical protein
MTGHETAPNGMATRDYVLGWDLNGGTGFASFKEALNTIDHDHPPYDSLWKIKGEIFRMIKVLEIPVFDLYEEA